LEQNIDENSYKERRVSAARPQNNPVVL